MRLHNTLTRSIEPFQPQDPSGRTVTLYTCGPTVYNYYHIGNLRNAVFNDTLRRALEANGYQVQHVMNITDVGHLTSDADEGEDKLEKGAIREGKTVWEVAEAYTAAFKADMQSMNVQIPSLNPHRAKNTPTDPYARATDFIPEQITMVQQLLDKGFAYQTEQAIYFDVTKLPSYGELTGQKLADKEVAARSDVIADPHKRGPHDFAVWFFAVGHFADHAMQWDSPWGSGFPGWHLECSAIIHATLDGHADTEPGHANAKPDHTKSSPGHPIDLHTGGVDHIGTHHPNEMAQTQAALGHPLANYWLHNEFILVDGAKMSKSKGNSYTLGDITDRGYHPLALRLLYLQAHYRSEINFTWESLDAATNRLINLYAWADRIHQADDLAPTTNTFSDLAANDLNTPEILSLIDTEGTPSREYLEHLDKLLGLNLSGRPDITATQKHLVAERETARQAKDWARADQLRAKLADHHLVVDDTPSGSRWRRTTI